MADYADNTPLTPMQPGLLSYVVYDQLPDGCFAHEVADSDNMPHLRPGDFVVVDSWDREPAHGELSLIRWKSGRSASVTLTTWLDRKECWAVGGTRPAFIAERAGAGMIPTCVAADYGYRTDYMREVIVGRIVGIYQPDFRSALRTPVLN